MKRATKKRFYTTRQLLISIHALVKRATAFIVSAFFVDSISIHALVKRATLTAIQFKIKTGDFNPRPREEGDTSILYVVSFALAFQSTPS